MHSSHPARSPKSQLVAEQPLTGGCWNLSKKDTPCPKAKKPQQDGRRGTATIKSNPIPTKWVTYKLENSNTKDVLSLLWRYWSPHQASKPGDLQKRRNSHGIWPWRPVGFDYKTSRGQGKQILQSWRAQTKPCMHQDSEERAVTHQEIDLKLPPSVGGSPVEAWVTRDSPLGWGHRRKQSGKAPLGVNPHGGHH